MPKYAESLFTTSRSASAPSIINNSFKNDDSEWAQLGQSGCV